MFTAYADAGQTEEEKSNDLTESSDPNGVLVFAGVLKDQISCQVGSDLVPSSCKIDTGIDNTNEITGPPQPPLISVMFERDAVTPYYNGKLVTDRAEEVGLDSKLITITGPGHVNWDKMLADDVLEEMTTTLVDFVADGSQGPSGCTEL